MHSGTLGARIIALSWQEKFSSLFVHILLCILQKRLKDNKTDLSLLHSWKIIEYPDQTSHNIEMKRNSASCNKCIKNQLLINDTDNHSMSQNLWDTNNFTMTSFKADCLLIYLFCHLPQQLKICASYSVLIIESEIFILTFSAKKPAHSSDQYKNLKIIHG